MTRVGMLAVLLLGVRILVSLGCSGQNAIIRSRESLLIISSSYHHTVFISFRFAAKAELHEWGQY